MSTHPKLHASNASASQGTSLEKDYPAGITVRLHATWYQIKSLPNTYPKTYPNNYLTTYNAVCYNFLLPLTSLSYYAIILGMM